MNTKASDYKALLFSSGAGRTQHSRSAGRRWRLLGSAMLAGALALAAPAVHAQAEPVSIQLAAQPLHDALVQLGRQTSLQFFYTPDTVAGLMAPAVRGSMTAEQALQQLLRDTSITYRRDGRNVTLSRVLSSSRLDAVTVRGQTPHALPEPFAGGQTARGGRAGMLGNQDVMDLPFTMTSYTAAFLRNQQAVTIADALAYDSSVAVSQTGGMVDSYSIRGFPVAEGNVGEIAFNGVYGVAPNYRAFTPYVERVEVLKGATGLLYGMSPDGGVGGVINIVPKRAGDEPITRVSASYGSRSLAGGQLDLGRRFGPDQRFGVRFNGSHEQGHTAVDHQKRRISVGALALDYKGEQLRASLDLIAQSEKWDAPSRVYSVASGIDVPDAPDGKTNPAQAWGWSRLNDRSALLDVEYDLNPNLTLFANAGHGKSKVSRLYDQQMVFSNEQGDFTSTPRYALFEVKRDTATAGLRTAFQTGALRHKVALQLNSLSVTNYQNSQDGVPIHSNLYDSLQFPSQDVAEPSSLPRVSRTRLTGIALSDTMSLWDDRVQVIAGVRHQRVASDNWDRVTGNQTSRYRKNALTPSLGLIVRTSENTMVYASYIEGLSKGDVAPQSALNAGEMFAPYKSKQYELGFKVDYQGLNAAISLFQLTKPSGYLNAGVFGIDGEQRNRGVELSLQGQPLRNLRVLAGMTFLDAKLTQTSDPALQGNRPVGVPAWHATLGLEWDTPWVRGLTLTSGLIYSAKQYVNQQNSAHLPAWARVDVGARYATVIDGRDVNFQLNVQNLFNRKYWSGVSQWSAFALGSPRVISLSASMAF